MADTHDRISFPVCKWMIGKIDYSSGISPHALYQIFVKIGYVLTLKEIQQMISLGLDIHDALSDIHDELADFHAEFFEMQTIDVVKYLINNFDVHPTLSNISMACLNNDKQVVALLVESYNDITKDDNCIVKKIYDRLVEQKYYDILNQFIDKIDTNIFVKIMIDKYFTDDQKQFLLIAIKKGFDINNLILQSNI